MRWTALVALALVTALTAAGCGKAGSPSATPTRSTPSTQAAAPKVLSKADLKASLLTPKDVGEKFKVGKDDKTDDTSLGCLDEFGDIDQIRDAHHAAIQIDADTDFSLPTVYDAVGTFTTTAGAASAMSALRRQASTCEQVRVTDSDGTRYRLTVTHDEARAKSADEQLNLTAGGTLQTSGVTVKVAFEISMIRVGNNLLLAGYGTAGRTSAPEERTQVVDLVLPRLVAIMAGDPVPAADPLGFVPLTVREDISGTSEATA